MKKLFAMFSFLALSVVLVGCGDTAPKKAEKAAEKKAEEKKGEEKKAEEKKAEERK